jgi:hypothetical protein
MPLEHSMQFFRYVFETVTYFLSYLIKYSLYQKALQTVLVDFFSMLSGVIQHNIIPSVTCGKNSPVIICEERPKSHYHSVH